MSRPRARAPSTARAALLFGALALLACAREEEPPSAAGELPAGRWNRSAVRTGDPRLDPEERDRVRRLESLGYASGSLPPSESTGVVAHDPARAEAGANLVTSAHEPGAWLLDMQGRVLHRWQAPAQGLWRSPGQAEPPYWRRVHLLPDGDLLVLGNGVGLAKLDRDSRPIWSRALGVHHDLDVGPDGGIYLLTRQVSRVEGLFGSRPFLEDYVSVLDADGHERRRVSLVEALVRSGQGELLAASPQWAEGDSGDPLHANGLEVLDGRAAGRAPALAPGLVLVSLHRPSALAAVDLERERVVWVLRGSFRHQHDPRVLEDGHLLIFDNLWRPGASRALELDPGGGGAERWSWPSRPGVPPFFSRTCGTAQRLAGGNTLVTESDNGRALEVTPDGEVVWEFRSPHRAGARGEYVATLFEVERLPRGHPLGWARGDAAP